MVFVFVSTCPKHKQVFRKFQDPFWRSFSQFGGKIQELTERKPNKKLFRFWFFHTCIFTVLFHINRTHPALTNLLYILQYLLPCACIFEKIFYSMKNPGAKPWVLFPTTLRRRSCRRLAEQISQQYRHRRPCRKSLQLPLGQRSSHPDRSCREQSA